MAVDSNGIDQAKLDAALEFADAADGEAPEGGETPEDATPASNPQLDAIMAQNAQLASTVTSLTEQLGALRTEAQVAARLREALTTPEVKLDEKQMAIREELFKMVPDLADLPQQKQAIAGLAAVLNDQMRAIRTERSSQASEFTSELMEGHGLDPNDAATYRFIEQSIVSAIQADPDLKRTWDSGKIKRAVTGGFKMVSEKLLKGTPSRAAGKATAVKTVSQGPRATGGGIGAAGPARAPKVDHTTLDTAAGRAALHNKAFAHLDALLRQQE